MTSTKKAAVSLIKGRHITAADKRNIVEGIEYLRQDFAPTSQPRPPRVQRLRNRDQHRRQHRRDVRQHCFFHRTAPL